MRIRRTLLFTILLNSIIPLTITIIVFSFYTHSYSEDEYNEEVLDHLLSISSIQKSRLETLINSTYMNIDLVTCKQQMKVVLQQVIEGELENYDTLQSILFEVTQAVPSFHEISLFSLNGITIASTNLTKIAINCSSESFFIQGLISPNQGDFFLEDLHLQHIHQYLSAPLFANDTLVGVVMITADANNLVELTSNYAGLKNTGETVLAKRNENGDALFITPLRFDPQAVLNRTVSKESLEVPIIQALLGKSQLFTDAIDYRGKKVLASTEYIESMGWGIVVKIDKDEVYKYTEQLYYALLVIFSISVIVIVAISFFISKLISEPIIDLSIVSNEISDGNFSKSAKKSKIQELNSLATSFNQMADSIQEEIIYRDLLISIVSHDIPNFFVITKGYLSLLEDDALSAEDKKMFLQKAHASIIQSANLLSTTTILLKERSSTEYLLFPTNICDTISEVQEQINELYSNKSIELIINVNLTASVMADALFSQVFVNLLTNSVKNDNHDVIKIEFDLEEYEKEDNFYILSVTDYGKGIAPADREVVFDRFNKFRTKGSGSGLGLYITKTLINRYHGEIWIESRVESDFTQGTKIVMKLPRANLSLNSIE